MLRPRDMSRLLIVGPKELLEPSIDTLHTLRILHIQEFTGGDDVFHIGKPLPKASEISEALVRLRSASNVLHIEPVPRAPLEALGSPDEVRQRIAALEAEVTRRATERKALEAEISDLARREDQLRPFVALGLPLDLYVGYSTLEVFIGTAAGDPSAVSTAVPEAEVFAAEGAIAVFVPRAHGTKAREALGRIGFTSVDIPTGSGDPRHMLASFETRRRELEGQRATLESALAEDRERFASFVLAAERVFVAEIEKAEAPLRFATTDHSFVVDGWVPTDTVPEIRKRLEPLGPLHVEQVPLEGEHAEPPVLLSNPKPVKPFETLVNLYSTPSYHEIDPTLLISLALPFFFGFMVGDAGFGLLWIVLGLYGARRFFPRGSGWANVALVIMVGGIVALAFGLFVFGEAFGIAFHAAPTEGTAHHVTWDDLGVHVPLQPLIEKAAAESVTTLLLLSVVFAWIHLSIGYVVGFFNEIHHNRKHSIAKLGWFLALLGLFMTVLARLYWHPVANFFWTYVFPVPHRGSAAVGALTPTLGFEMPLVALVLIVVGAGLALLESALAPIELGGVLANMMSYTRLAGIAIGEAAIDGSITTLIFQNMIFKDIGMAVVGFILLVMAEVLLMLLLGGIGVTIQALRLNYVEQFIKFFKGGGTPFRPFGTGHMEA